jgi:ferrous iron transport protein B
VKVFGVIFGASVILWLLNNINIKFEFVGECGKSILYSFSTMISWVFKPIGLGNPNIICALLVGLVAKELTISSFSISNKATTLSLLATSLTLTSSAVHFNLTSGMSFLVFTLLYCPCISNLGVLTKEVGLKYTLLGVGIQLISAYSTAYIVYSILCGKFVNALVGIVVAIIILLSVINVIKKIKNKSMFCNCMTCNQCSKLNK